VMSAKRCRPDKERSILICSLEI